MKIGIEEEPKYRLMWYKLAKMYLVAGHIDEALKTCNTCLKLDPENITAKKLLEELKSIKEKDKQPSTKQKTESEKIVGIWTEVGYEKFKTEAIEEYKKLGRIPIRGGNVTLSFRKWYNKNYRKEL